MRKDVFDLDDVLERVQDDWELLLELLDIFEEDYKDKRAQLSQEISKNDFEQIRNIAHSLKGASGNISAVGLHAFFLEMEQAAVNKDMNSIQMILVKLDNHYPELLKSFAEVREDYKKSKG